MSDIIRIISIVVLFGLAFFCLQVGVFYCLATDLRTTAEER